MKLLEGKVAVVQVQQVVLVKQKQSSLLKQALMLPSLIW